MIFFILSDVILYTAVDLYIILINACLRNGSITNQLIILNLSKRFIVHLHIEQVNMDTSTVRLLIFVSMFLIFAGDYNTLISSIFGNTTEKNVTDTVEGPKAQLKGPHDKITAVLKEDIDKNNGKNKKKKKNM